MAKSEFDLLAELSSAPGPPGFEDSVRSIVQRELSPLVRTLETDGIGSLIAKLDGNKEHPRLMLSAHMDEVGLMVRYITEEGFLKFQTLGGWLDQALINQRWNVMTEGGLVKGITGIKTPHVMPPEDRSNVFKKSDMFIDVGATSKKDAEERLKIKQGDAIAPDSRFERLNDGDILLGKAWDDRIGLAVMIEVIKSLKDVILDSTVFCVATAQEEIGLRGAYTSTYNVAPDIGINLESGVAGDYPGTSMDEAQEKIGHGPAIFLHDSSMLPNLRLKELVVETARSEEIPLQFNVLNGYGQDGAEIQRSRGGTPSINITVPTRYLHSHNSLVSKQDFDNAVKLVTALIKRIDDKNMKHLREFD